ncbi:MAG: hypothetical protein IPM00_15750 [Tetrasphaera sp.]|nr:hypothetical protein [Tetrasphaera sp.]
MASLTRDEADHPGWSPRGHLDGGCLDLTTGCWSNSDLSRRSDLGCREPGSATFVELNPVSLAAIRLNGRDLDPGQLDGSTLPAYRPRGR